MPPTETKAYSPGAADACSRILSTLYAMGLRNVPDRVRVGFAEVISRQTCDREMLEALKDFVNAKDAYEECVAAKKAKDLIAKVEGR